VCGNKTFIGVSQTIYYTVTELNFSTNLSSAGVCNKFDETYTRTKKDALRSGFSKNDPF